MLFSKKSLKFFGLMSVCGALGENVSARDGYFPLDMDSWEQFGAFDSPVSRSISSSSSSENEDNYLPDPDIFYYCNKFLFGEEEETQPIPISDQLTVQDSSELRNNLVSSINSYTNDALEYILCHTDLKNIQAKGGQICEALTSMKALGIAANSDLIGGVAQRISLDTEYQAHANVIPMILTINSTESKLGNEPTPVSLPEGNRITIPTFKPIMDGLQDTDLLTKVSARIAQDAIDTLFPQVTEIIDDLVVLENQVWSLIHGTSEKLSATLEKLSTLEQNTPDILFDNTNMVANSEDDHISSTESTDSTGDFSSQESWGDVSSTPEESDDSSAYESENPYHDIIQNHLTLGDRLSNTLFDMKEDATEVFDKQTSETLLESLDLIFQHRILNISDLFGIGEKQFKLGYYVQATFTLPEHESMTIKGFRSVLDKIQGLSVLTKHEAYKSLRTIDDLIHETTDIIFNIAIADILTR